MVELWVNQDTGEAVEVEPDQTIERALALVEADSMAQGADREAKRLRSKLRRVEAQIKRDEVRSRDKGTWGRILEHWRATFPKQRINAAGLKSARATAVFLRLEQITGDDAEAVFMRAIDGARKLPYVVYGERRSRGSASDLAIDLQQIAEPKSDVRFDSLVAAGEGGGDGR